ncbi:DinB family protein [Streptacidiphilus sp. PAMC 29251]
MTPPGPVTRDVLTTFDDVRDRTLARLEGLSDAEYLWEPVGGCLTVRASEDGAFRADPGPEPDVVPAPFTTIGWRIWHIGADCLRSYGRFFGDGPGGDDIHRWPGTAAEGVQALAEDWSVFRARIDSLGSLGDDHLLQPMGPRAGAYSQDSYLLLALHALDEAAHHGAEIGVLRDLYLHGGQASAQASN